jgi:hypothetical protein
MLSHAANPAAIDEEEEWDRCEEEADEAREAGRPVDAQRIVHVDGEQGEDWECQS